MLTLYYAPQTRASRCYQLLHEMGALDRVRIEPVEVARRGAPQILDPKNPHPEGKVPTLVHDGALVTESPAVFLYLTDLLPGPLGPQAGEPDRGPYMSWLSWYGDVMEPVLHFRLFEIDHPGLYGTFRDFDAAGRRLGDALQQGPWLLGERFSAADILVGSTFQWLPDAVPEIPAVQDWVRRCAERPSVQATREFDATLMADA